MIYDLSRTHPNNPFRQPVFVPAAEIFTDARYPISGSRWLGFGRGPAKVDTEVVHYQGVRYPEWKLSTERAEVIRRLIESNISSWNNRDYALYYNFDLPTDGTLYGIREFNYRNAANADDDKSDGNENDWSFSVHCVLQKLYSDNSDTTVEPTWDQLETLRWLRWEAREYGVEESNNPDFMLHVLPHRDIKPTGCPGDKMTAHIRAGTLNIPARWSAPLPDPQPPPGGIMGVNITVFQPSDCLAEFIAYTDDNGFALQVEWIETPRDQQRRDAYLGTGKVGVDRGPRTQKGFVNCGLIGKVPTGDTFAWTEADFAYRIPKSTG